MALDGFGVTALEELRMITPAEFDRFRRLAYEKAGIDLKAGAWNTVEMQMATNGPPWFDLRWSGPGLPDQLMQSPLIEPDKD